MSQLFNILRYLDREDISEIVLQTGRALTIRIGGEYRPMSKNPINTQQIEGLLMGTPLAPLLPQEDTGGTRQVVHIGNKDYQVRMARRGPAVQVRIEAGWSKPGEGQRGDDQVGPLPKEDSKVGPLPDRSSGAHSSLEPRPSSNQEVRPSSSSSQPPSPQGFGVRSATEAAHRAVTRPVNVDMLIAGSAEGMNLAAPLSPRIGLTVEPRIINAPASPRTKEERRTPGSSFVALVQEARSRRASDLHLVTGRPAMMRTAGELLPVGEPLDATTVEHLLLSLLSEKQKDQLARRGYVDFALDLGDQGRLRANVSRQRTGLKGSFRLVMHPLPSLEDLGLPKELARVTSYHQGLVVIAGPNGHGKTTTMAAIVDLINSSKPRHILTVEEPVEFLHPRKQSVISQREVGLHTRTFASALKASLREDPDVIVIGELRDRETVETALTAAETGHLVIVTMSTPSAAKTIDRLIDFFPPDDQPQVRASLAGALKFIVAQRLLPSVSGDCFVPAVELLTGVPPLWALIRDNKLFQLPSLQQRGRSFGMIRFDDSLVELYRAGKITEETALRHAENRKEMANMLHPAQVQAPLQPAPSDATKTVTHAATQAAKGIQDLTSKVGNLFGKKE
ncbi:MAG: PilT/PilU family type 4a pilus ATPase [Myxococcales bacterium]|nr:PilT/PilU family type 4a pilus ATPase [Polyangiaceae bacterium]MDW8251139.1 PilT/PilU family type 4a pilus ATPase [Myxococcales bacterium]